MARWLSYLIVAALSVALGVGATFVALRLTHSDASGPAASGDRAVHQPTPAADGVPPGDPPSDTAVYISPARQQLIGVRTAEVSERALDTTIRTAGVLAYDETRVAEIHPKIAGWVESVAVDFVGKPVRRGQVLFQIYSPDLVATQKEYLLALKAHAQLGSSRVTETREGAASLLAAARERLRLWDITDAQIAELERTGQPRRALAVYSPLDGIVLERNAFPGQYISPEVSTFKIVDLATIWVVAQLFEYELPMVKLGQSAEIVLPYGGSNRSLTGRVTFIYPEIDPMTRRVKVRVELRNPGLAFKPESYVTVLLRTGAGRHLAVPKEAVIDTGAKRYVLLALADGYFEPRELEVGEPVDDFYPVRAGLKSGDRVVTSAQFLIDSETNLQSAMQALVAAAGAEPGGAEPAAGGGPPKPAAQSGTPGPAAPAPARATITFRTDPDPPRTGDNTLEVTVTDAQGKPVTDAQVSVVFFMPAMPAMGMPTMRSAATLTHTAGGTYRGVGQVVMGGRWDVTITVTRGGQRIGSRQLAVVAR